MKRLLSFALILTMVFTLSACGTQKADETVIDETVPRTEDVLKAPVTIDYWYCFTDTVEKYNLDKVKEFNDTVGKQLGITVNAVNQQDYTTVAQKLQAAAVAGKTPAVVLMGVDQTPFVNDSILLPLDGYIKRDQVDMKDFQEGFLAESYFNSKCYSIPFLKSTAVMIYNKTMFDKAGLDGTKMTTWNDFKTYSTTLHSKLGVYGVTTYSWPWIMDSYLKSYNSGLHNSDNSATNINSTLIKNYTQMFLDLKQSGTAHLIPQAEYNNIYTEFASGKTAMIPMSTGAIVALSAMGTKYGFEVGVSNMPKGDINATVTGGANLAVTTKISDAEKEAGWQFVKFMTNADNSAAATIATGYLPTRISANNSTALAEFIKKVPQMQVAINQLVNAKASTAIGTEETRAISSAVENIWISDADLTKTLQEAETKINALIKEAK